MSPPPSSNPVKAASPAAPPAPAKQTPRKKGFGFPLVLIVALVLLLAALFFFGVLPRRAASAALDQEQKLSNQRNVVSVAAHLATPTIQLPLPGTIEAFQQASLYARTNGYVKKWNADIGDIVREGQVLAEIDTPEIDQQLDQAKATLDQSRSALEIAQTAADRWNALVKTHAVSQQEADERNATFNGAKASFSAAGSEVGRLTALENFKRVTAPFTGKITYRNIEVGNLVTAPAGSNTSTTGSSEIFRLAQTDPLRVYVDVPEANSRSIKPGVVADLHVAAYSDRVFHGAVARSAGSLDPASRTLRTEIRVANPDGALLPGSFANVTLNLVDGAPAVLVPANALIVNATGTQVAVLENSDGVDKVHFRSVKVGRDFGTEVEILEDVQDGDRLVTNPPADMVEGETVNAKPLNAPNNAAPKS